MCSSAWALFVMPPLRTYTRWSEAGLSLGAPLTDRLPPCTVMLPAKTTSPFWNVTLFEVLNVGQFTNTLPVTTIGGSLGDVEHGPVYVAKPAGVPLPPSRATSASMYALPAVAFLQSSAVPTMPSVPAVLQLYSQSTGARVTGCARGVGCGERRPV